MFTVKVYQRKDARVIDNQVFDNMPDAVEYFNATGFGESYWTEMVSAKGVTMASTA